MWKAIIIYVSNVDQNGLVEVSYDIYDNNGKLVYSNLKIQAISNSVIEQIRAMSTTLKSEVVIAQGLLGKEIEF